MKKLSDLLAFSLILIGMFNFVISFNFSGLTKYLGLIGSTALVITQVVFLWQTWTK